MEINQDFNDNVGNEHTDLCFHCRTYKDIKEFNTPEGKQICKKCNNELLNLSKEKGVIFIEEKRNQEHFSGWYRCIIDHIDVYTVFNNQKIFIRGYVEDKGFDTERDKSDIFDLKIQFLKSNLKTMVFHGDLKALKEYDFYFELEKLNSGLYDFSGNCLKVSNSFHIRSIDLDYLFGFIEYHNKLTENQKEEIKKQISQEYISFCSYENSCFGKNLCFHKWNVEKEKTEIIGYLGGK